MKTENMFALLGLNFTAIKTIKDACKLFGQQGSSHAAIIAAEMEKLMENVEI